MNQATIVGLAIFLPLSLALSSCAKMHVHEKREAETGAHLPKLILWSWEHDDHLEYIDPWRFAVAEYAGTIILGPETATLFKRKNRLNLNRATAQIPVFRLDLAPHEESVPASTFKAAADLIADYLAGQTQAVQSVQIDFDATESQRQNYLFFLQELRKKLPRGTHISITALASWCLSDKWLARAPVDETVAMLFSLGPGRTRTLKEVSRKQIHLNSGARALQSIGISINEPDVIEQLRRTGRLQEAEHIYIFSSLGWTRHRYEKLCSEPALRR